MTSQKTYHLARTNAVIQLGSQLGRGGEATVYDFDGQPDMVVKIKHKPLADDDLQKLQTMLDNPPDDPTHTKLKHHSIAWPIDLVYERDGTKKTPIGFVMPKMKSSVTLSEVMHPGHRQNVAPQFSYRLLLNIGKNLAIVVKNIHAKGHVIGDMNTLNIMVSTVLETSTLVTVIDCDSFQIKPASGQVFRCKVGKPEFTAPEIQNRNYSQFDRTQQHDMFAFAVIMYQLMMQNAHPFQGIPKRPNFEESMLHVYNIANGIFPHLDNPEMARFPHVPSMMALPATVRDLMLRSFLPGYTRPSASDWDDALTACVNAYEVCVNDATHTHVRDHPCVICEWEMINNRRPRVTPPIRELLESDVPSKHSQIVIPDKLVPPPRPILTLDTIEEHASWVAEHLPSPYPYRRMAIVGTDAFMIGGDHAVIGFAVDTVDKIALPDQLLDCIALTTSAHCLYALRANGMVAGWSRRPTELVTLPPQTPRLRAIAAGADSLLGLTEDGTVLLWGTSEPVPSPVAQVLQIAAGAHHWVAMSATRVWLWGNTVGQDASVLSHITDAPFMIAAADDCTVVLTTSGTLHHIARGIHTQIGVAIEMSLVRHISICKTTVFIHLVNHKVLMADIARDRRFDYFKMRNQLTSQMIDVALSAHMVVVQGGTRATLLKTTNFGKTATAQHNVTYQSAVLGITSQNGFRVSSLLHVAQQRKRAQPVLAAGESFSAVYARGSMRTTKGFVAPQWPAITCVYAGRDFLVGVDDNHSVVMASPHASLAARVPAELRQKTIALAAGDAHIVAVAFNGSVYAWGDNNKGQATVPAGIREAVAVAAGSAHSLVLRQNGTVSAWGDDRYGQCTVPSELRNVAAIWAGSHVSAALTVEGELWLWGELEPNGKQVFHGLRHVVSVSLGKHFGTVLFADGSVVGWGANDQGQATPPTLTSPVVAIASGASHTVALLYDGTITGWGDPTHTKTIFA
ncbi:MAG: hypothetical protein RLY87_2764 [Chloroflexota bacterium]|jgi:serine/threonine protein kinase/bifunctional DNA-binding transcriptional regulator/antitoxin component of YhaV-PrlF toxin-antitoxin module